MTAPSISDLTAFGSADGATSHSISMPTTVASGDLLVAMAGLSGGPTYTWPGDWTAVSRDSDGDATIGFAVKLADGTEGGTGITLTTDVAAWGGHRSYAIAGAEDPATQAPDSGTAATGSGTSLDPPNVSVTGGPKDILAITAAVADTGNRSFTAFPTGYSDTAQEESGGSGGATVGVASRQVLSASSEDPGAFTLDLSRGWVAQTIAIHPAATGGSTGFTAELSAPSVNVSAQDLTVTAEFIAALTAAGVTVSSQALDVAAEFVAALTAAGVAASPQALDMVAEFVAALTDAQVNSAAQPMNVTATDGFSADLSAASVSIAAQTITTTAEFIAALEAAGITIAAPPVEAFRSFEASLEAASVGVTSVSIDTVAEAIVDLTAAHFSVQGRPLDVPTLEVVQRFVYTWLRRRRR